MNNYCRDGTWWYSNTIIWNHGYISRWWQIHDKQFCVHNQNWRLLNREHWKYYQETWSKNLKHRSLRWRLLQNKMPDTYRYHLIIIYIEQNCEEITMNHVSGLPCAFRKKGCYLNNCEKHCDVYLFLFMQ